MNHFLTRDGREACVSIATVDGFLEGWTVEADGTQKPRCWHPNGRAKFAEPHPDDLRLEEVR